LRLQGRSLARRAVISRRRLTQPRCPRARHQTAKQAANLWTRAGPEIAGCEVIDYEYQVLVANLTYGVETLAPMNRALGDAETLRRTQKPVGLGRVRHPATGRKSTGRAVDRLGL